MSLRNLEKLPNKWCWCIGNGRLGISCRIFEREQVDRRKKRQVIIEYGNTIEEAIEKCLERFNEIKSLD